MRSATDSRWATLAIAVAVTIGAASLAWAQGPGTTPSPSDLAGALACKPGQDCATPPPPPARKTRGITPGTRSFEVVPKSELPSREDVEQKAKGGNLPTVDMQVTFDFDSDVVGAQAQALLSSLGIAMHDPRIAESRFAIIGHTDGVGTPAYNQALSERRANAVRRYLMDKHGIAPARLDAYGRGMSQLKNLADPKAAENRRVQVINQGPAASAR